MRQASRNILFLLIVAATLFSCSKPIGDSSFVSSDFLDAEDDGWYRFQANLEEGIVYSTSIAMRLNTKMVSDTIVTVKIYLVSPDGDGVVEMLDLPLSQKNDVISVVRASGSILDFRWLYRENIKVQGGMAGLWKIYIKPCGEDILQFVKGMGFSYSAENGKR